APEARARGGGSDSSLGECHLDAFSRPLLNTRAEPDNVFFHKALPGDPAREEWRARQHPAAQAPVRSPSDYELQDELDEGPFTIRAANDTRDSAAVREQVLLDSHRIPKLNANFVIARPAVTSSEAGRGVRPARENRACSQVARHHCVVDAFGGKGVDESARVARHQHAATSGLAEGPADRNDEWREVLPRRLPDDNVAFAEARHERALHIVGRLVDGLPVMREHVADSNVDVVAFRKHVRITFGCPTPRTRDSARTQRATRGLFAVQQP